MHREKEHTILGEGANQSVLQLYSLEKLYASKVTLQMFRKDKRQQRRVSCKDVVYLLHLPSRHFTTNIYAQVSAKCMDSNYTKTSSSYLSEKDVDGSISAREY